MLAGTIDVQQNSLYLQSAINTMAMMMMTTLMRTATITPAMIEAMLLSTGVCVVVGVSENSTDGISPVVHGCIC